MTQRILFIHCARIGRYLEILQEVIVKISESSLANCLHKLYVLDHFQDAKTGLVSEIISKTSTPSINIVVVPIPCGDYFLAEVHTMSILQKAISLNSHAGIVGYLNLKGSTTTAADESRFCVDDWRAYMTYFLIDQHSRAWDQLSAHDVVGVDLRMKPGRHYSGNFWWANASHIRQLEPVFEARMSGLPSIRHRAEFFVTSRANAKYLSLWDSGIPVSERHLHRYPREKYI
jgi:hypothetical protein